MKQEKSNKSIRTRFQHPCPSVLSFMRLTIYNKGFILEIFILLFSGGISRITWQCMHVEVSWNWRLCTQWHHVIGSLSYLVYVSRYRRQPSGKHGKWLYKNKSYCDKLPCTISKKVPFRKCSSPHGGYA